MADRRRADAIADGAAALDQALTPAAAACLADYLALLTRWNRAYNLSAVRDPDAMVARHVLDSLAIRPWLRAGPVLDLGSGAGLPGLVLAIVEPDRPVTVLDTNGKKTRFLQQAALELALANVTVVRDRAGDWSAPGGFVNVTARAFADLPRLWPLARPYLAAGSALLAMKGQYPSAELAGLPAEGVSCNAYRLVVPGLEGERHLVVLEPAP